MDLISITAVIGSPLVIVCAASSTFVIVKTPLRSPTIINGRRTYEDSDGVSSREAVIKFSDRSLKILANVAVLIGLFIASSSAFKITASASASSIASLVAWMRVGSWERSPIKRFQIGILISCSVICLLANICWESYGLLVLSGLRNVSDYLALHWASLISQIAICAMVAVSCLSLPRRPDVFMGKEKVDNQYTVSLLSRYTFSWADPLFRLAKELPQINFYDLSALDHNTRSFDLLNKFRVVRGPREEKLWMLLYKAHRNTFWWEWTVAVAQGAAAFAPQLCLYQTLTLLQQYQASGIKSSELWFWAVGIGISRFMQQALETRLTWICTSQLEIPIKSQLSAVIYQNSLEMANTKGRNTSSKLTGQASDSETRHDSSGTDDEDLPSLFSEEESGETVEMASLTNRESNAPKSDESDLTPTSIQGTINLLSVDATRVAEFAARQYVFIGIFITILIAILVLVKLIGLVPLLAGLIAPIILTPINIFSSKAYAVAQKSLMKERDEKISCVTEALQGIRQIKFSAAESEWEKRIMAVRDLELLQQRRLFVWTIMLRFFWISSPILLSLISLATYSWIHKSLSPSVAFTALGVFGNLEFALSSIPFGVTQGVDASVSSKRIEDFIYGPRKKQNTLPGDSVQFQDTTIAWPHTEQRKPVPNAFTVKNANAKFPAGKLSIITGKSGSGKSLILSAIIGEADILSGSLFVPRVSLVDFSETKVTKENWIIPFAIAFVGQVPWVENASIKENILFGLPMDRVRYRETLAASALLKDLKALEDGDDTEIGPRGVNLSGGQRWRITFARALYSRAGILVLDDIFSAVDTKVGRHLLEKGLAGKLCTDRTRIIATHHYRFCLPWAAYGIQIANRTMHEMQQVGQGQLFGFQALNHRSNHLDNEEDVVPLENENLIPSPVQAKAYVEEEFREQGNIKFAVYKKYLESSGGLSFWIFTFAVVVASQLALLARGWWMKLWTQDDETTVLNNKSWNHHKSNRNVAYYLIVYAFISIAAAFLEASKCGFVYLAALQASRKLFQSLIHSVLRAPLRWIDTVPIGRIINRACADFNLIDSRIPGDTHTFLSAVLSLVVISATGITLSPFMIVPEFILLVLCIAYTVKFLHAAQALKRLDSISKSPTMELYGTTLMGLDTVRAFGKSDEFTSRMLKNLDNQSRASWSFWLISQWMAFRMGVIGAFFALFVALTVTLRNIDASLAGFALVFALDWTKNMEDAIRRFSNLQLNMNSTERVVEYGRITTENADGNDAPAHWPTEGRISISNLHIRYAEDLPDVLKGVNLDIRAGERVGLVGRTGAGKSSFALALLRCLEARQGNIWIDGIDISTIKLENLRSRLPIIPQDPVLFSGTIRSNLDRFGEHSDALLHEALSRVYLIDQTSGMSVGKSLTKLSDGLNTYVSEGGLNFSQGERQLLCLARTIINPSKVLIMDEATSSVDMATDSLIQRSIKEHFSQSTLVVIAHRLTTVSDFDKIVVMVDGKVAEVGDPKTLLEQQGEFCRLVQESGEKDRIDSLVQAGKLLSEA